MAQAWMKAKDILAARHGKAASGAGRPMGDVTEDRNIGRAPYVELPAPKPRVLNVVRKRPCDCPKAWRYNGATAGAVDIELTVSAAASKRPRSAT